MRFLIAVLLVFFSVSPAAHAAKKVSEIGTEVGRQAPPIELNDLSGNPVTLDSLKGQVVLLNFWSTVCAPCMAEMPSLNRLQSTFKDHGLQVVTVSIDDSDQAVRDYVAKNNIGFTVLLDSGKETFFEKYSSPPLPATYLIDRTGVIVEKFSGLAVWDAPEMRNRVQLQLDRK